jgi:hypothetical protein
MGNTWKATLAYSDKWSKAETKMHDALKEGKRVPVYIHLLAPTVEEALDAVNIKDAVDYTKEKWKKSEPLAVKDFSPDVLQGYNGTALEKAIKNRYQREFAKNALELYQRSASLAKQVGSYEEAFKDDLQFEK